VAHRLHYGFVVSLYAVRVYDAAGWGGVA